MATKKVKIRNVSRFVGSHPDYEKAMAKYERDRLEWQRTTAQRAETYNADLLRWEEETAEARARRDAGEDVEVTPRPEMPALEPEPAYPHVNADVELLRVEFELEDGRVLFAHVDIDATEDEIKAEMRKVADEAPATAPAVAEGNEMMI